MIIFVTDASLTVPCGCIVVKLLLHLSGDKITCRQPTQAILLCFFLVDIRDPPLVVSCNLVCLRALIEQPISDPKSDRDSSDTPKW